MSLTVQVYGLTRALPKEEVYGLASQMLGAAVSIPSSIAEGHARLGSKEYVHFLSVALGSHAELETLLDLAVQLYPACKAESLRDTSQRVGSLLWKLRESIRAKL